MSGAPLLGQAWMTVYTGGAAVRAACTLQACRKLTATQACGSSSDRRQVLVAPEERLGAVHDQRPPRPGQRGRAERQADARLRERREQGPMRGAVPAQLVQEVPQVVRAADRHQAPCNRQVDLQRKGRLVKSRVTGSLMRKRCKHRPMSGAVPAQRAQQVAQMVHAA